ncbi:hypothetical protein KVR01_012919 [Diaporthe batatas]|uniref:uncharacterized protein n=1 Tax=Diaporthe batatas TaxID=748121 RepID=UPI001D039B4A|nr:uncharacterized protein KVR01_012919 [Diaporthe batatas]KAG8157211.1 hypothetical protein KVR01_012919 [Diaporthe batatas]
MDSESSIHKWVSEEQRLFLSHTSAGSSFYQAVGESPSRINNVFPLPLSLPRDWGCAPFAKKTAVATGRAAANKKAQSTGGAGPGENPQPTGTPSAFATARQLSLAAAMGAGPVAAESLSQPTTGGLAQNSKRDHEQAFPPREPKRPTDRQPRSELPSPSSSMSLVLRAMRQIILHPHSAHPLPPSGKNADISFPRETSSSDARNLVWPGNSRHPQVPRAIDQPP